MSGGPLVAGRRDELVRLVITEAVDLMVWSLERHLVVARLCRGCELSVPPNRVVKCVESMRVRGVDEDDVARALGGGRIQISGGDDRIVGAAMTLTARAARSAALRCVGLEHRSLQCAPAVGC
jgi:hypothetical protein